MAKEHPHFSLSPSAPIERNFVKEIIVVNQLYQNPYILVANLLPLKPVRGSQTMSTFAALASIAVRG